MNENDADVEDVGSAGCEPIAGVGGATVSTVHVAVAAEPVPLDESARTENVCDPWAKVEYARGELQDA